MIRSATFGQRWIESEQGGSILDGTVEQRRGLGKTELGLHRHCEVSCLGQIAVRRSTSASGNRTEHFFLGSATREPDDEQRREKLFRFRFHGRRLALSVAAGSAVDADRGDTPQVENEPGDGVTGLVDRHAPAKRLRSLRPRGCEDVVDVGEGERPASTSCRLARLANQPRDAQKLISTEGTTDGLYWPTDDVNGESPAGDLSQAELDAAAQGDGYFGYRFKILNGQGDRIAGGAYDYVVNGNMIGGFALVAWPARYAETGVHTFAVNEHGIVYEADLGPATETIVKYIDRFNPDETWSVAAD